MAVRKREYYDYDYSANYYNNSSTALEALPVEDVPIKRPKKRRKAHRGTRTITEDATDKAARPSVLIVIAMGKQNKRYE